MRTTWVRRTAKLPDAQRRLGCPTISISSFTGLSHESKQPYRTSGHVQRCNGVNRRRLVGVVDKATSHAMSGDVWKPVMTAGRHPDHHTSQYENSYSSHRCPRISRCIKLAMNGPIAWVIIREGKEDYLAPTFPNGQIRNERWHVAIYNVSHPCGSVAAPEERNRQPLLHLVECGRTAMGRENHGCEVLCRLPLPVPCRQGGHQIAEIQVRCAQGRVIHGLAHQMHGLKWRSLKRVPSLAAF